MNSSENIKKQVLQQSLSLIVVIIAAIAIGLALLALDGYPPAGVLSAAYSSTFASNYRVANTAARMCETDSLSSGAQQILQKGPELVVVKRGEKGAIVYSRDQEYSEAAFNVPICSTAGAGDSFDAGFIAAELRQASLRDALLYANAVAAIKVTRQGARAVPNHQEVMEFLDARGLKIHLSTNAAELSQPLQ